MEKNYWLLRVSGGNNGYITGHKLLNDCQLVSIGWADFSCKGFLQELKEKDCMPLIDQFYQDLGWSKSRNRWNLWRFVTSMKKGDYIVVPGWQCFGVYEIEDDMILDINALSDDVLKKGCCNRGQDGYLYDLENKQIDLGFFRKVRPIKENLSRIEFASPRLCSRMKIQQTSANINDLKDDINLVIEGSQNFSKEQDLPFNIDAAVYTLCANSSEKKCLLIDNRYYEIPIYQREYSWGEEQVGRFIRDIFEGYERKEPMFIGTMQLSAPIQKDNNEIAQEVIDGQQRLSTIICLLKYLSLRYPNLDVLKHLRMDWLSTRVNNERENNLLEAMLNIKSIDEIKEDTIRNNKYLSNVGIIDSLFSEQLQDEEGNPKEMEEFDHFLDYILGNLYFVVIETRAGLSKTLQIFNTINTAGLDLSGEDLFKVRFFEYLKTCRHEPDSVFDEISKFYGEVKAVNDQWHEQGKEGNLVSMSQILTIYKDSLYARHNFMESVFDMGTDTFFDYLFDQLLGVQDRKDKLGANAVDDVVLSLDDLRQILRISEEWNRHTQDFTNVNHYIDWLMLGYSRYGKFRRIAYQLMWIKQNESQRFEHAHQILSYISRIAYCESIRYSKIVGDTTKVLRETYKNLYKDMAHAENRLNEYLSKVSSGIESCIGRQIFEKGTCHRTWGNLICVLSECLAIVERNPLISVSDMTKLLYDGPSFDFEHIHATNDKHIVGIAAEYQNSIGNLMLLEYSINRSIGNKEFFQKIHSYKKSRFVTAKEIVLKDQWTEEDIKKRKETEIKKIKNYLISPKML